MNVTLRVLLKAPDNMRKRLPSKPTRKRSRNWPQDSQKKNLFYSFIAEQHLRRLQGVGTQHPDSNCFREIMQFSAVSFGAPKAEPNFHVLVALIRILAGT